MEVLDLEKVEAPKPLKSIVDIVNELNNGNVLRVEGTSNVLIRIKSTTKYKGTEISYDIEPETFYNKRYWRLENVSLNFLMNNSVYLDDDKKQETNKFKIGQAIRYVPKEEKIEDLAKITGIYIDKQNNYYYTLTNDNSYYNEVELSEYK